MDTHFPNLVGSNSVTVTMTVSGDLPEWMAVNVKKAGLRELAIEENIKATRDAVQKWKEERKTNSTAKYTPAKSSSRDLDNVKWIPFATNMLVDLGPGDGKRDLLFGFRYKGESRCLHWSGSGVVVSTDMTLIVITEPAQHVTSQP
ncbi:MAG: hypothetical protein JWM68_3020, partial [Verrucomicrobiales bacterium]|nr:hypothetical protein [Verrucomicrobiales bacterium]